MKVWTLTIFLVFLSLNYPVANKAATVLSNSIELPIMEIKASRLIKGDNNKKATNIPKRYKSSLQAKKTMFTEEIQELIKCYKTVNRHFNKSLSEALKEYSGPQITISSGVRPWSKKSLHRTGKACDISWNKNAVEFVKFCESEKGKLWLDKNHLRFYVEDNTNSTKDKLDDFLIKYFRKISHASGLHLHLEVTD